MQHIYLDNAATTPVLEEVVQVMSETLTSVFGNPSSMHQHGQNARAAVEKARNEVAHCLGARPGEIYFTSGGTESNNTVFHTIADQMKVSRFITSPTEHPSVLNTLEYLKKHRGVKVDLLSVDRNGQIDPDELEKYLSGSAEKTLVSLMYANNETGLLHPIHEIGQLCKEYGALFHTDAVQGTGHLPIDLATEHISFLSASGHKFHGPKGTGILYVNKDHPISSFLQGGNQEKGVRSGTENIAGIVGIAKALSICHHSLQEKANYVRTLREHLFERISQEIPQISPISLRSSEDCLFTIINLSVPRNEKTNLLLMNLDLQGISVSGGSACHSGAETVSDVIKALGRAEEGRPLRVSLSFLNKIEEIDFLVDHLKKLI